MFKSEDDVIYTETQCNHLKLYNFQKHVMITRGDYVSRIQDFVAS